ncbi:glycosyltransferase family 4 protein [Corynebacterium uberis]|uniref:glycosyltransferase family 4 protein n=1 Tax=Corynebacterium uberis TaxID=2883169 RepID=UPI001D0A5708|nr:glycosyltransferase family 4 protein [Corynebacterium uberis]UDL73963.1 glycosyltransferase family 4 protein [Corynebacterium uberis]UDL81782.1 glycosyltransferase family 4 protein [Corynebacterium uberis]
MAKTLVVTNDFPPHIGGIESYVRDYCAQLDPESLVVFASTRGEGVARWDEQAAYEVVRWPHGLMLPTPAVARAMQQLIRTHGIDTVWFGACAPLALLAGAARAAGARCILASTHGHEIGWAHLPGGRQALRWIGNHVDVITYISTYTLQRLRGAFGEHPRYEWMPSGVDVDAFRPFSAHERAEFRNAHGLGSGPIVACVSRLVPRKGQDQLIAAVARLRERHPGLTLVLAGTGSYESTLRRLAAPLGDSVRFCGRVDEPTMRGIVASADVVAMPARTRWAGMDVEGLGIVYLEAQASGVPVIAGRSGGAPETVAPDAGVVVNGYDVAQLVRHLDRLLGDPQRRARMGAAGRRGVEKHWGWQRMGQRFRAMLG